MGCFSTENTILLQPDYIVCAIFLALLVKARCGDIKVSGTNVVNLRQVPAQVND